MLGCETVDLSVEPILIQCWSDKKTERIEKDRVFKNVLMISFGLIRSEGEKLRGRLKCYNSSRRWWYMKGVRRGIFSKTISYYPAQKL